MLPLIIAGTTYEYPQTGDGAWGDGASGWAQAVTNNALFTSGGTFTLSADVNFGATFGLISKYFTSRSSNPASSGVLRLSTSDYIQWRNSANTGNLALGVDSSNRLTFNGVPIGENSWFNARTYGAVGDGTTDDTTALQAMITAAQAVNGIAYIPYSASGYKITNTLTISNECTLIGDMGPYASSATSGSTLIFNGSNAVPMITVASGAGSSRIANLALNNLGSATMALNIAGVHCYVENVTSHSLVKFSTAVFSTFQAASHVYDTKFVNCRLTVPLVGQESPIAILFGGGNNDVVDKCFLSGFPISIKFEAAGDTSGGPVGCSVTNTRIETFCGINAGYPGSTTAVGIYATGPSYGLNVTGCSFEMNGEGISNGAAQRAITLNNCQGANIAGNQFYGHGQEDAISLPTANATGIWIAGNSFFDYPVVIEVLNSSATYRIGVNDYTGSTLVVSAGQKYNTNLSVSQALATDSSANIVSSSTSKTQLEYLSSATGTTGTNSSSLVFSASPVFTGTPQFAGWQSSSSVAIGASPSSNIGHLVTGSITSGSATHFGSYISSTFDSSATTAAWGHSTALSSAASAFTMAAMADYYAQSPSQGAGSTITRFVNYRADQVSGTISNAAVLADNMAFSGYWFINQSGTQGSLFGGTVTVANLINNNLTATTVVYADGSKQLQSSATTPTQLGYLSSATGTTGTANLVFSASPTFTGTIGASVYNGTGVLATTGNIGVGTYSPNISSSSGTYISVVSSTSTANFELQRSSATTSAGTDLGILRAYNGTTPVCFLRFQSDNSGHSDAGAMVFATAVSGTLSTQMMINCVGNVIMGNAAISTSAVAGFLHIVSMAGAPSGVPTGFSGRVPLVYDTTNNKLWIYNGAWKGVVLS